MGKPFDSNWEILNRYPADITRAVLESRQVEDVSAFLNPDYGKLVDPLLVPGMKKAIERIGKAAKRREKIGILMDYDADGIPGGAIIYRALKSYFDDIFAYVPTREAGYGLSREIVDEFKKRKVDLFITVDCGIGSVREVSYAKKQGIDVIVTDHHEIGAALPESAANVHPGLGGGNPLKFRDFSGGGVAFLLAKALCERPGQEKWLLDLAAISSVADVVSLRDDNRLIVKFGLKVLNKTKNIGLRRLIESAGLRPGSIGTYEVGYMLAPRINAAGRISVPRKSFQLLVTRDDEEAKELAEELNELNAERQEILEKSFLQAREAVRAGELFKNKIIVVKNSSWPDGIIGLLAGKIAQKFYRPTIVFNERAGKVKGSARSIPSVNVYELIGKARRRLLSFGGHEQAAGLVMKKEELGAFTEDIISLAGGISDKFFQKTLKIDALVSPQDVTLSLVRELEKMEPFGPGNPRVTLAMEGVRIASFRKVGRDEKHIRLEIEKPPHSRSLICFRFEENGWNFKVGEMYDVAFTVKPGEFRGREKVDLILEDAKLN